jgi:NAD(P)-dependent dehydrogenase (short-subunit alcohol dehydrogenase family)
MKLQTSNLTGKVAIVTGGYQGIGRGIAEGLAEAGSDIVICARNYGQCVNSCLEIEKLGIRALPIKCDITKTNEVHELVITTIKEFGRIDILVNNAGVGGSEKPIIEMSDEDWDYVMNTNLRGPFLCTRETVKEMIKQGGGKIINISSTAAFKPMTNMSAYCASKGGLIQFTKVMALELAKYNIQVNALCPGYFLTPMNREFFESEVGQKIMRRKIPIGRLGIPEELKGIVYYLASSASDFMTGSAIVIDGGHLLK